MRSSLDPTNDIVFKLLFGAPGSRRILTALLTAVLDPPSTIVVVDVRNPEILPEAVADKTIALDLHVALADGRHLDVEMQTTCRRTFRDRALYYWSRVFSGQLERGATYDTLRPVISVLFLDYVEPGNTLVHDIAEATSVLADLSADPRAQELARMRQLARVSERLDAAILEEREAARAAGWSEGRTAGLVEGRTEGRIEELRATIQEIARLWGLPPCPEDLESLDAEALVALRTHLLTQRRWRGGASARGFRSGHAAWSGAWR